MEGGGIVRAAFRIYHHSHCEENPLFRAVAIMCSYKTKTQKLTLMTVKSNMIQVKTKSTAQKRYPS